MILQYRLRAYDASAATWIVGVYDDRATADRVKGQWQAITQTVRFVVERNP